MEYTKTVFITDERLAVYGDTIKLESNVNDFCLPVDTEIELTAEIDEDGYFDLLGVCVNGKEVCFSSDVDKYLMDEFHNTDWESETPHYEEIY